MAAIDCTQGVFTYIGGPHSGHSEFHKIHKGVVEFTCVDSAGELRYLVNHEDLTFIYVPFEFLGEEYD